MARLWDCFPFFRELDLLEIRLRELWPRVHRFVLVEASYDFAGNPKPLHFLENRDRFQPFLDKIEHVVVEAEPAHADSRFARQRWQRDRLVEGLGEAAPDDHVLISDLDEIPNAAALVRAQDLLARAPGAVLFRMPNHEYRLDLVCPGVEITAGRMVRRRHLRVPHLVRQFKYRYWKSASPPLDQIPFAYHAMRASGRPLRRHVITEAGWHFSSVGRRDVIEAKAAAFVHDELLPQDYAAITAAAEVDQGVESRLAAYRRAQLSELPACIGEDLGRFGHLLAFREAA